MVEFARLHDQFLKRINNVQLKDYWSIKTKPNESLDINHSPYITDISTDKKHILFSIHYSKTSSYDFNGLPREISNLINEYARDKMDLIFRIIYPRNFPFRYTTWEIHKINHNYTDPENKIYKTIQNAVDTHNCNYTICWTPIIRIETDFLGLFIQIKQLFLTNS